MWGARRQAALDKRRKGVQLNQAKMGYCCCIIISCYVQHLKAARARRSSSWSHLTPQFFTLRPDSQQQQLKAARFKKLKQLVTLASKRADLVEGGSKLVAVNLMEDDVKEYHTGDLGGIAE